MVFIIRNFFCTIVVFWVIVRLVCDFKCVRGMQNDVLETASRHELFPLSTLHGKDSDSFPILEDDSGVGNSLNVHDNNKVIPSRVKSFKNWLLDFLLTKKVRILPCMYVAAVTSSVHWGFNNLQQLFYKADYFAYLCGLNATGLSEIIIGDVSYRDCAQRSQRINDLHTVAFASHLITSSMGECLMDYVGPKFTGLIGLIPAVLSWVLFGLPAAKTGNFVYYIAAVFLGMSVEPLYSSLIHVSNLFPGSESTIITLFETITTARLLITFVMNEVYQLPFFTVNNLSFIFVGYMGICLLPALLNASFLVPYRKYDVKLEQHTQNTAAKKKGLQKYGFKNRMEKVPFIRIIIQPEFYLMTLCVAFSLIKYEFYVETIKDQMVTSTGDSAAYLFTYVNLMTFLSRLLLGMLVDRKGVFSVIPFINIFGSMMYVYVSLDNIYCKYVSLIFFWLFGSLITSPINYYIKETLPDKHFNKFVGLMTFVAGLFSLLSSPLYMLSTETFLFLKPLNFVPVNVFMSCLGFINAAIFALLYCRQKRAIKNFRRMMARTRGYEDFVDTNADCTQIATPKTDHDNNGVGSDA